MQSHAKELTIVTFNVWFGGEPWDNAEARYAEILRLTLEKFPDIIAFQEVTGKMLAVIEETKEMRSYEIIKADTRWYDTIIAVHERCLLSKSRMVQLPTNQGRNFKIAEFKKADISFALGNVHLESMRSMKNARQKQLEIVLKELEKYPLHFLCGDFNFCATSTENKMLAQSQMNDVWEALKPEEPGWTEDTERNAMRYRAKPKKKQVRFDRILWRGDVMTPSLIELLGTDPFDDKKELWPSDHFGLLATFQLE